jgi:hypothetical protein
MHEPEPIPLQCVFVCFWGIFTLTDISKLAPAEQAKRYRAEAHSARVKAALCSGPIQASFIKMAGNWEQLALEAEAEAGDESAKSGR